MNIPHAAPSNSDHIRTVTLIPHSGFQYIWRGENKVMQQMFSDARSGRQIWVDIPTVGGSDMTPDITNPDRIPFGELPRAAQEAMVIAHALDGQTVEIWSGISWLMSRGSWDAKCIFRVVQP